MYQAALGRASDDAGRSAYVSMLANKPNALLDIAREIRASDERRRLERAHGISDHSQFGEFPRILRRLVRRGAKDCMIVDVGARGRDRSNSYDLLSIFGWRGVLVEANPSLYASITDDFAGTDFELVQCAVGVEEGTMPFYIGANDDVSSLLPEHAAGWGDLRGEVNVPVRRLAPLLTEIGVDEDFDILSLDIEGLDIAVFNDLIDNSRYRPRYVIIEASYNFATRTLQDVNCSSRVCLNYDIVDQTEANLILARVE